MATNNFLPFCPTDTGTNLLTQVDYAAATDRTSGNKPGIASARLNNKAIRQATFIVSQVAQFISDRTGNNVLDDADTSALLANIVLSLKSTVIPVRTTTMTDTVTLNDGVILCNATGGAYQETLPAASAGKGLTVRFKKIDSSANAVTIARAASDTIDGATSVALTIQYEALTLISDGVSSWSILS